jgi:hypothetical protein
MFDPTPDNFLPHVSGVLTAAAARRYDFRCCDVRGWLVETTSTGDRAWNGVTLGSITLVTVFGRLIAQVWTSDRNHVRPDRFRFSIAAGIIVAYVCLLCILAFNAYLATARKPSPSAALPAIPSVQPSAHPTGDGE